MALTAYFDESGTLRREHDVSRLERDVRRAIRRDHFAELTSPLGATTIGAVIDGVASCLR
jgi:hypothetical protein